MRRARIQIRPNIGGRGQKPVAPAGEEKKDIKPTTELSKEEIEIPQNITKQERTSSEKPNNDETKSSHIAAKKPAAPAQEVNSVGKTKDSELLLAGVSTSKDIVPGTTAAESPSGKDKSTVNETATKAPAVGPVRRSRIKPQVKVMAKPRGAVATGLNVAHASIKGCTKVESEESSRASSTFSQPPKPNEEVTEKSSESKAQSKETKSEISKSTDKSQPSPVVTPAVKRGRFIKPRPNLNIDAARKRSRQSSFSGASDTDDDSQAKRPAPIIERGSTQPRGIQPPPVQRLVTLASPPHVNAVEPAGTIPNNEEANEPAQQDSVDGAVVHKVKPEVKVAAKPRLEFRKRVVSTTVKRELRKTVALDDPVDKSKMKISDLIYSNPKGNRMKSTMEEEARRKRDREKKQDQLDGSRSVIGSPERRPSIGSPDRQSVRSEPIDLQNEIGDENPDNEDDNAENGENAEKGDDRTAENNDRTAENDDEAAENEEDAALAPQVTIGPDGNIVLNEKSLIVSNPDADRSIIEEEGEVVEEFGNAPYNPSMYYGRAPKTKPWGWRETKKFYLALSVIGCDFSMMSQVFPQRSRTDLKKKFKKEEKVNRFLVDKSLKETKTYDIAIFDELSASEDEETKKQRKKEERERKRRVAADQKREAAEQRRIERQKAKQYSAKNRKKKVKSSRLVMFDDSSTDSEGEGQSENVPPVFVVPKNTLPGQDKSSQSFTCELCGKVLKTKTGLKGHLQRHTNTDVSMDTTLETDISMVNDNQNLSTSQTKVITIKAKPIKSKKAENSAPVTSENCSEEMEIIHTAQSSTLGQPSTSTHGPVIERPSPMQSPPGSEIVFVYSDDQGAKLRGEKVVHMYMVSPPPCGLSGNKIAPDGHPNIISSSLEMSQTTPVPQDIPTPDAQAVSNVGKQFKIIGHSPCGMVPGENVLSPGSIVHSGVPAFKCTQQRVVTTYGDTDSGLFMLKSSDLVSQQQHTSVRSSASGTRVESSAPYILSVTPQIATPSPIFAVPQLRTQMQHKEPVLSLTKQHVKLLEQQSKGKSIRSSDSSILNQSSQVTLLNDKPYVENDLSGFTRRNSVTSNDNDEISDNGAEQPLDLSHRETDDENSSNETEGNSNKITNYCEKLNSETGDYIGEEEMDTEQEMQSDSHVQSGSHCGDNVDVKTIKIKIINNPVNEGGMREDVNLTKSEDAEGEIRLFVG